jgi:hypothetical protein
MSIQDRARDLMMRHTLQVRNRQQSLLGRAALEVGLPLEEVAHYNGTIQGKLSSSFRAAYDRSHASLS